MSGWQPWKGGGGNARDDLRTRGVGILDESCPREICNGSIGNTSGRVVYMAVGLKAGDVVTNIIYGISAIGVGVTLGRVGLYSKAGVLLAQSGDISATLQGTVGFKASPLTAPFTIPADDVYYLAWFHTFATTACFIVSPAATTLQGLVIGTGVRPYALQGAQVDLPANAAFAETSQPDWLACN